jgi:uncharacterized protein YjbI with pentapeptide repeats
VPTDLAGFKALHAILPSMDFTGRNLTGADFRFSTIKDMKFNNAILTNAKLAGLDLKTVKFGGATVTNMDISSADLSNCDLSTVISTARPITSTDRAKPTVLAGATLKAGLLGKDWSAVNLNDAKLLNIATTDLRGINAAYVQLMGVELPGANFNPVAIGQVSNFRGALFHGANLQRTQFREANLAGAQFGEPKVAFRMPLAAGAPEPARGLEGHAAARWFCRGWSGAHRARGAGAHPAVRNECNG